VKRTPLYDEHVRLGAKMVPFGGWDMPVFYPTGVIAEHNAVRSSSGLFDIGHMGAVKISGPAALPFLQKVFTNDPGALKVGDAQYSLLLNENGGVIDDVFVYRLNDSYLVVLNASNTEKDLAWLNKNLIPDAEIKDIKDIKTLLALQGPRSQEILQQICDLDLKGLGHHKIAAARILGVDAFVSRTGYTGEDGFELFFDASSAGTIWNKILSLGALPAGLGARDTLRLEAGMPLYDHEYNELIMPLETPFMFAVKLEKGAFVGRDSLVKLKIKGVSKKLVGIKMDKTAGIPRQGYKLSVGGRTIGNVTSGTMSPTLNIPIGMGYVSVEYAAPGKMVEVEIRDRKVPAEVVRLPFYKRVGV